MDGAATTTPHDLTVGMPDHPLGGWLGPDGRYWRCSDDQDLAVARRIVREVLGLPSGRGARRRLRRAGWCRVLDDGRVAVGAQAMTDAQADTLVVLSRVHPSMAPREVSHWDQAWYWDEGVVPTAAHPVLPPSLLPEPSGGWISPNGRMWRCHDARHEDTAAGIIRELRVERPGDPGTYLEDRGWIHVLDYGAVMSANGRLTQAQMDVLFDLAQAHPSMRRMLMDVLEIERRRSARE